MAFQYNELIQNFACVTEILFRCKHFVNGCHTLFTASLLEEHEENCDFRVIFCPYPDASCAWNGPIDQIFKHLLTNHKKIVTCHGAEQCILATGVDLIGPMHWFVIQSCFGQNFAILFGKQYRDDGDEQYYVLIQLIKSSKRRRNFTYRVELSGSGQILAAEGTIRTIGEGPYILIDSCDCFMFDSFAAQFFTMNGNLKIHVRISEQKPPDYEIPVITID